MIEIKDKQIWGRVIKEALVRIDSDKALNSWAKVSWNNAVAKAAVRIEESGTWMTWQPETDSLLILSDSNNVYEANGKCQCKAFEIGRVCWHRASAGLVRNYFRAVEKERLLADLEVVKQRIAERFADQSNAPYLRTFQDKKPERVGGIRI